MAFRKNKPLWTALIVALVSVPLIAFALIEPKHMNRTLRTMTYVIPRIAIPTTGVTVETQGVIAALPLYTSGTARNTITWTSSIGALPYPAKVRFKGIDGGAGTGAITCTSATIRGKNQFGVNIDETVSTLSETDADSARVYESLSYISATGCAMASGGDTSDFMRVSVSPVIGLPVQIRQASDIISACINDASASTAVICYRGSGTAAGNFESLDEAGAIDLGDNAVDMADATLDTAIADQDTLIIRLRPNPALP